MPNELVPKPEPAHPMVYHIRLKGHLDCQWTDWFAGLTITLEDDGETLLAGPLADQAALHGVLRKVRDLGMPLLAVTCVEREQPEVPGRTQPIEASTVARKHDGGNEQAERDEDD